MTRPTTTPTDDMSSAAQGRPNSDLGDALCSDLHPPSDATTRHVSGDDIHVIVERSLPATTDRVIVEVEATVTLCRVVVFGWLAALVNDES